MKAGDPNNALKSEETAMRKLAHLTRESSNRLFEILEDWSHVLRYTRLGKEVAEKAKNGKDGSALRDNRPVAVRRRKTG